MEIFKKKRFTWLQVVGMLAVGFFLISSTGYAVVTFTDFTSGTTLSATTMNTKLNALKTDINGVTNCPATYTQFAGLNGSYVNLAANTWTALSVTGSPTFTKVCANTNVEVYLESMITGISGTGASYLMVRPQIDSSVQPTYGAPYVLYSIATTFPSPNPFINTVSVFSGLAAGSHTLGVYAYSNGAFTNLLLDPGGFGGRIIVKETAY